jgi:hypothetical protein
MSDPERVALLKLALGEPLATRLGFVFQCMEWADQEIAAAEKAAPDNATLRARYGRVFGACAPSASLVSEPLYRAHVRELLVRAGDGAKLAPATDAEILGVLSEVSQRGPFDRVAQLLYEQLFGRCFPEAYARILGAQASAWHGDKWAEGEADALRAKLARGLAPTLAPRRLS